MVTRLRDDETRALLSNGRIGRLGCVVDGEPYVVPVSYVFEGDCAYLHSLPGTKINALRERPRACLQVDHIETEFHWRSAIAFGDFEEIRNPEERSHVMNKLLARFPMLTPVESAVAEDAQPPSVVVFRIRFDRMTGAGEG